MILIRSAKQLQAKLEFSRRRENSIGFVPTMGALHEGHLSLIRASKKKHDVTVVSIFVNPTQFGPQEDFKKYPRVLKQDTQLLKQIGVDYVFYPSVDEMYPTGTSCSVKIDSKKYPWLVNSLCGKYRAGHFEGVATVVTKLFNIVGPCRAYLGAKDWQQTRVVHQLIQDFKFPVRMQVLPTMREKDGLALSSRNRHLSRKEREKATYFPRVLVAAKKRVKGKDSLERIKKIANWDLTHMGLKPQYFEFVDSKTLEPLKRRRQGMRLIAACFVGKTRLIDNLMI